jgi:CDP-diacylglycerol--glycerol-3-phosphate 3-phosphatidyltransferase/cardiolipin synthase
MDKAHTNKRPAAIFVFIIIAIRYIATILFLYTFTHNLTTLALCIFLVAVFTDALDGYVARKLNNAVMFLGPYSDAVADFFLVLTVFSAFVSKGLYPIWVLLNIIVMFVQFILTSRLARPVYDPLGKYYGVFLFCVAGVTQVLPNAIILQAVPVVILGFSIMVVISRVIFLCGPSKKAAFDQDRSSPKRNKREVLSNI